MRGRSARSIGVAVLALVTLAAGAFAQTAPATPGPDTPAPAASPATSASAAPASGVAYPAGATWSDTKTPTKSAVPARHHFRRIRHASSAEATLPGFEMLADGGSRVFVQLTKSVDVSEQRGQARVVTRASKKGKAQATTASTITYVLRGTDVLKRNNENALVTVHFNTPVASARLVGAGTDARLVVSLRADATPTWKIEPAKNGTAILEIDFPKGDYLPAEPSAPPPASPEPTDSKQN